MMVFVGTESLPLKVVFAVSENFFEIPDNLDTFPCRFSTKE